MSIRGGALALDLISFAADENGKHVAARKHSIHLEFFAIQPALPASVRALQFQAVVFAVDGDVVKHR